MLLGSRFPSPEKLVRRGFGFGPKKDFVELASACHQRDKARFKPRAEGQNRCTMRPVFEVKKEM